MFEDALKYPWTGEEKVKTLLIGGLCSLFAVLIIPGVLAFGYQVRVTRQVSQGETETPPVFDDWGGLFVDGLAAFGIIIGYIIVTALLYLALAVAVAIPIALAAGPTASTSEMFQGVGAVLVLVAALVEVVVIFTVLYLLPAGLAAYAYTGKFSAAFSPSTLRAVGTDRSYAIGVLVALGVSFVAQAAGYAALFTIVGILLVPVIGFYGNVASAYAIGAGVADTPLVSESRDVESPEAQPAV
ncbi:DUF4013 domain-containing protein [Haloarcula salinisoli]|uniref:DUF4013 domain-containing protein n=1 Tax=Haloarcula salinisoli TaxID=2487746 RepID=A0A8J7YCA5_9EURY|nr:DUF4013 domain-containing protein [Halomicroarcula salinisoli]MBX0303435.1 DUF4013 domain-containing protein [Halomicroarcula salinisoli]